MSLHDQSQGECPPVACATVKTRARLCGTGIRRTRQAAGAELSRGAEAHERDASVGFEDFRSYLAKGLGLGFGFLPLRAGELLDELSPGPILGALWVRLPGPQCW